MEIPEIQEKITKFVVIHQLMIEKIEEYLSGNSDNPEIIEMIINKHIMPNNKEQELLSETYHKFIKAKSKIEKTNIYLENKQKIDEYIKDCEINGIVPPVQIHKKKRRL